MGTGCSSRTGFDLLYKVDGNRAFHNHISSFQIYLFVYLFLLQHVYVNHVNLSCSCFRTIGITNCILF